MVGFCINHFRFSLLSGKRNNFERPPSNEIEIAQVMVITYESSNIHETCETQEMFTTQYILF